MARQPDLGIAPGPPGHFLLGHLREFRSDVLALLLEAARRYGDVVRFRLGPSLIHLINHPDGIEQVLQKRAQNFDKATRSAGFIRLVCGESLLTSNGASWQNQRRLAQPFFHQQSVRRFATLMVSSTSEMLAAWRGHAIAQRSVDLASEMMQLTYRIAAQAFFNAGPGLTADRIERAMQVILPFTFGRLERVLNLPRWLPTPENIRFRRAVEEIDTVVFDLIAQHRSRPPAAGESPDLLGMLLAARGGAGDALSDWQIRDQTITFLLAGHETTSNALTWAFYLIAQHPGVQLQLREEVQSALGGEPPSLELLPRLTFLRQVFREAMRLYPPIWIIERRVIAEDWVGGIRLPANSTVVVCPYTLHRHPAFWENPDEFRPERFAAGTPPAYLPFGAGPRFCIGSEFALLEAQLIMACIVQEFRVELVPGTRVAPKPGITLRTRNGLPITLRRWEAPEFRSR